MIEHFTKWAIPARVSAVTSQYEKRLQEKPRNINKITTVTDVAAKKQEPVRKTRECEGLAFSVQGCTKNVVMPVTPVTQLESLGNICNQDIEDTVTPVTEDVPGIGPIERGEVDKWPAETQHVFLAVLDYFKKRRFALSTAEALAYATMQVLMQRHGGLIRFAETKMPGDLAELIETVRDVFGGDLEAEWRPLH